MVEFVMTTVWTWIVDALPVIPVDPYDSVLRSVLANNSEW